MLLSGLLSTTLLLVSRTIQAPLSLPLSLQPSSLQNFTSGHDNETAFTGIGPATPFNATIPGAIHQRFLYRFQDAIKKITAADVPHTNQRFRARDVQHVMIKLVVDQVTLTPPSAVTGLEAMHVAAQKDFGAEAGPVRSDLFYLDSEWPNWEKMQFTECKPGIDATIEWGPLFEHLIPIDQAFNIAKPEALKRQKTLERVISFGIFTDPVQQAFFGQPFYLFTTEDNPGMTIIVGALDGEVFTDNAKSVSVM